MTSLISEDLYSDEYEYLFIGDMSASPLFRKNELWDKASSYARFGNFGYDADTQYDCYNGTLDDMGLNINLGSYEYYLSILDEKNIVDAPAYPDSGAIMKDGNVIIIKISERIGEH